MNGGKGNLKMNLNQLFSPKSMTKKDDQIRIADIPERMQISEESTGSPPTDEINILDDTGWIYNQLLSGTVPLFGHREVRCKFFLINVGDLSPFDLSSSYHAIISSCFQIPFIIAMYQRISFIAMYRREECLSLLKDPEEQEVDDDNKDDFERPPKLKWHKVLWAIQDLDRKWLLLQKRKSAIESYYKKHFEDESRRIYVGVDEGQYKRPKRKSQHSICSKAGLWEVASKFGYSSEQLGV
ncbi:hypothetical protein Patl1_30191 [Pistacia atlantica]|uniref:Uncharacterized protein n=1 Tax=Pistacia atlantica TaxID=434234 RepID=A0ACC1ABP0_9ROSI|nr:hypothetical protein Patl1_30191 [Pistacia atlantica]